MKNFTILFLFLGIFGFNRAFSQACPDASAVIPFPTEEVIFAFNASGPPCGSRPAAIVIDGSAYILGNCDEFSSQYVLSSGSGVIDPQNYTVTYGSSACVYVDNVLGLKERFLFNQKTLSLFPNPVKNDNTLQIKFVLPMSAKINVYDLTGKLLLQDNFKNTNHKILNVSNLSAGMYLLRLETAVGSMTRKFLVQN